MITQVFLTCFLFFYETKLFFANKSASFFVFLWKISNIALYYLKCNKIMQPRGVMVAQVVLVHLD